MHSAEYRHTETWPYHISAGGAIYRHQQGRLEVVVLYRNRPDGRHYHLPKGTLHHGETLEDDARREVLEESGIRAEIKGYLGAFTDDFMKDGVHLNKTTHYFAMIPLENTGKHDAEHDGVEWLEFDKARKLLESSEPMKKEYIILDRLRDFLDKFEHNA